LGWVWPSGAHRWYCLGYLLTVPSVNCVNLRMSRWYLQSLFRRKNIPSAQTLLVELRENTLNRSKRENALRSHNLWWCTMGFQIIRWCPKWRRHPCQVYLFLYIYLLINNHLSRVTPGGKAAAANVKAGDYLLAVNMQNLEDASLLNVMELIKG